MGYESHYRFPTVSKKQRIHRTNGPDSKEPIESNLPSTPKVLNQRNYCAQLSYSGRLQRSQTMECNQEQLMQYDGRSPLELQKLVSGQEVSVFQTRTKTCVPVEVKEETSRPGSYIVKTARGPELRRNRVHVQLKPSGERTPTSEGQLDNNQDTSSYQPSTPMVTPNKVLQPEVPQTPHKPADVTQKSDGPTITARSGRAVKKPSKLDLKTLLQTDGTFQLNYYKRSLCYTQLAIYLCLVGSCSVTFIRLFGVEM